MSGNLPARRSGIDLSDDAIDWLVLLRSGRATASDRAAFAAWRRRSPAHEAAAREVEALWRDIAEMPTVARSSERACGEAAGASRSFAARHRSRTRLSRRAVIAGGLAASLAFVVAGSGAFGPVSGVFSDYATRTGERREVRLPDGSTAVLNTATAIRVSYSTARRRVVLHAGEALFAVAGDSARPFVVATAAGEVRALGTVFVVRRESGHGRVLVSEGTVAVRSARALGRATVVGAGQQATFDAHGIAGPTDIDIAAATAWARGKLIFNKRPLVEVVAELERYQVGPIVLVDERLKASRSPACSSSATPTPRYAPWSAPFG